MNEVEFVDDADDKQLPVCRQLPKTTVYRDGKRQVVPYDPGPLDMLRAAELVVSGMCLSVVLLAVSRGDHKMVAFFLFASFLELFLGLSRWKPEKKQERSQLPAGRAS